MLLRVHEIQLVPTFLLIHSHILNNLCTRDKAMCVYRESQRNIPALFSGILSRVAKMGH